MSGGPYGSVAELARVDGVDPAVGSTITAMSEAMRSLRAESGSLEGSLTMMGLVGPFLWRAAVVWLAATAIAVVLHLKVRRTRWWKSLLSAGTAAFLVLAGTWVFVGPDWLPPMLIPVALIGVPSGAVQLLRHRTVREAALVVAGWLVASAPAAILTQAWF